MTRRFLLSFVALFLLCSTAAAVITSYGGNVVTNQTASAGTVINVVVPPNASGRTRVTKVSYTAAATAHSLYAMRPIGRTTVSSTAAASQKVINLTADPGPTGNLLAANDWLVIQNTDGTVFADTVASITGLAATMTTNLVTALSAGAKVWNCGIITDTDPRNLLAHPKWASLLAAAATTNLTGDGEMLISTYAIDEPIILQSNNATNAGTFVEVYWKYTAN